MTRRELFGVLGMLGLAGCSAAAPPAHRHPPARRPATPSAPPAPAVSSSLPVPTLAFLGSTLRGTLLRPSAPAYPRAARLFNPRFDTGTKPAAVARCADAADVLACVRFAAATGMPFAVRSGGHSYGGWSASSGLVIDVRSLNAVKVDRAAGTARIGAGANLAEVYAALAAQQVALAAGSCPTVGIAGLTMGGGVGVLTRAYGLTCDALVSVDIVTADGSSRTVDAKRDEPLFWALRGGAGGSFGTVTAMTFAVQPAPTVSLFYFRWDGAHGEDVLGAWQHLMAGAPDELWSTVKLLADPGSESVTVIVAGTWIGAPTSLRAQLDPLLTSVGAPPVDASMSTLDYLAAMLGEGSCGAKTAKQCAAAALGPTERLPFAATSSFLVRPLTAQGMSTAVATAQRALEVPHLVAGAMSFDALGGAVSRKQNTGSAFAFRDATATIQFSATYAGSRAAAPFDAYTRSARTALLPFTGDTAYVNYADASLPDYTSSYWAGNYPMLQEVKRTYDPDNLFTFPQAVRP